MILTSTVFVIHHVTDRRTDGQNCDSIYALSMLSRAKMDILCYSIYNSEWYGNQIETLRQERAPK